MTDEQEMMALQDRALELTVEFAHKHEYTDPESGRTCFSALGFARDLLKALDSEKAATGLNGISTLTANDLTEHAPPLTGWRRETEEAISAWGQAMKHGDRNVLDLAQKVKQQLDMVLVEFEPQIPVATLHDDGYYTWHGTKPNGFHYAGWRMEVYAKPKKD